MVLVLSCWVARADPDSQYQYGYEVALSPGKYSTTHIAVRVFYFGRARGREAYCIDTLGHRLSRKFVGFSKFVAVGKVC
jgi:hypothetical protein